MREWTYVLPGVTRPLSANQLNGGHWRTGARLRQTWRAWGALAWQNVGRPRCTRFTVALHYQPRDRRIRDPENLIGGALKALVDGMVAGGQGIARDDSPAYYVTTLPVIHEPVKGQPGRVWVVIRDLGEADA